MTLLRFMTSVVLLPCVWAGEEKNLEVQEPESTEREDDEVEEEEREGEADEAAGAEEEEPLAVADESRDLPESCKPKMKLFTGKSAAGLRIRSEPSRIVSQMFLRGMHVWMISMPMFKSHCEPKFSLLSHSFISGWYRWNHQTWGLLHIHWRGTYNRGLNMYVALGNSPPLTALTWFSRIPNLTCLC